MLNNMGEEQESVSLKIDRVSWFQCHLYEVFIIQKKWRVDEMSKKMGISADLLYRYIRGERKFPLDIFPAYLKATGDLDALKYLVSEVGYCLIPKVKEREAAQLRAIADQGNLF